MIQPIFKRKGSPDDPDNYRGITLLSCVAKLFTACINKRLTDYIESTGQLGEEQAGFREGYSTIDHTFVLHSLVNFYLHRRKRIYCLFVDYRKAFDLVDRSSLWAKLISHGINGNIVAVIYNMYSNAKSCVKQNHKISNFFECNIGVRQGENLSPLLFAIYLNDFEFFLSRGCKGLDMASREINEKLSNDDVEIFLRIYVLLYADDTIVMAESPEELQLALDKVKEYCDTWKLQINVSKTKVVIFSRGKVRNVPNFKYGEECIEIVDDYVYLGTTFNYNGKMNKAINKQVTQARRALFSMLIKCKRLELPIDINCELFDVLIVQILTYGCEIWGCYKLDNIETFHRKFMKSQLCVHKRTANCMVYGDLGRFKLEIVIYKRMIGFWSKIVTAKESKLSNVFYRLLRKLYETNEYKSDWIHKIKTILDSCGMSNIWEYPENFNHCWIVNSVELKLKDMEKQMWHAEVERNILCKNYKLFKDQHNLEKYLTKLDTPDRIILSKFRCGNHRLPVATERYNRQENLHPCILCDSNEDGDEYHYVLICPIIKEIREKYIKPYYYRRPSSVKFNQLFCTNSHKELRSVKFLNCYVSIF